MADRIVECIPNFSEARRPEVVEAIARSIREVPGVVLLDRHSDLDHNRTVLTLVGPPEGVELAAFQAIAAAAGRIDLDQHRGEHPRIGATDVVPFVPISGVSMQECVEMARRVGRRVGEELGIPVYLYEEAAARPERRNLENIRRGEYERLKEEIGTVPERAPDYGPARLGPAGATVIGARHPLIAYNVYLTTGDVSIAKHIARAVRHSSGGLRYVKALGLSVEGQAQVSMNLTNFRATPVARVVEMIRREAGRYGVGIHHSELVGLIPQEALVDAAVWYLQLDAFEPEQILEQRMAAALQEAGQASGAEAGTAQGPETSPAEAASLEKRPALGELAAGFLEALAAGTPTPGGGSAAAYSAAAGAALVAMVCRLTTGRKKYADVEGQMQAALERAEALRAELATAVDRDAAAFEVLMDAYRLPKDSPEAQAQRNEAIERATSGAARVPLEVASMSVEVLELAHQVVFLGNVNAISDGASGAALARAALTSAGYNVRINVSGLQDQARAKDFLTRLQDLERRAAGLEERIRQELAGRGGMSLG